MGYLVAERGLSNLTADTYRVVCYRFLSYLSMKNILIEDVKPQMIVDFLSDTYSHVNNRQSYKTISKSLSALRSLFHFLVKSDVVSNNPVSLLNNPTGDQNLPQVISSADIDTLLSTVDTSTAIGMRDRTIFELIYSCGLRVSEVATLKKNALQFDEGLMCVMGKGGKERKIPIGDQAMYWLRLYINECATNSIRRDSPYIFTTRYGNPISRKTIWKRFHYIAKKLNLKASVHTLRHSFATHLLEGGAHVRVVQELLGHASVSTTQIYTHTHNSYLKSQHQKHHPR